MLQCEISFYKVDNIAAKLYSIRYKLRYAKYLKSNSHNPVVFVHPPKTAGTSIADALCMEGPGHFTLDEHLASRQVEVERCVVSVRHPLERLKSLFKYSRKASQNSPMSSTKGLREFDTLNEFILSKTFRYFIRNHYFFKPQYYYAQGVFSLDLPVNFVRTEYLEHDLALLGVESAPLANMSPRMEADRLDFSEEALALAEESYKVDILFYDQVVHFIENNAVDSGNILELDRMLREGM